MALNIERLLKTLSVILSDKHNVDVKIKATPKNTRNEQGGAA